MGSTQLGVPAFVVLALAACVLIEPAGAAEPVAVKDDWVRVPAPGQTVAGAYMELSGRVKSALVSVASPIAARGKLHSTAMEDGVMKMRPLGRIELAAGQTVRLEPGGLHVMLVDLKRPLKPGDKVPLTLTVQRADFSRAVFTV
jgi:copper(I)-binding protein